MEKCLKLLAKFIQNFFMLLGAWLFIVLLTDSDYKDARHILVSACIYSSIVAAVSLINFFKKE